MQLNKDDNDAIEQSKDEELERLTKEAQAGDLNRTVSGMQDHTDYITEKKVGDKTHIIVAPIKK